jgi:hypothetical protein
MPYVKLERRNEICVDKLSPAGWRKHLVLNEVKNAGELNYAVTQLMLFYFSQSTQNYQAVNDIVGAIESAKTEFQRRKVAVYEDEKIKMNGDVY